MPLIDVHIRYLEDDARESLLGPFQSLKLPDATFVTGGPGGTSDYFQIQIRSGTESDAMDRAGDIVRGVMHGTTLGPSAVELSTGLGPRV